MKKNFSIGGLVYLTYLGPCLTAFCQNNCLTISSGSLITTYYDMQTIWSSGMQRIYLFPDRTLSIVAMGSHTTTGTSWPDRGSMYNYYDNVSWEPEPASRVEPMKTGWPSIQPWGNTGECILAHKTSGSLVFSTRPVKGNGSWTTTTNLSPPSGISAIQWPRMVTSGIDHMNVHVIAVTEPTANGGIPYYGMDGALLYTRSTDGGNSWDSWQQLPGMTTSDYLQFSPDTYAWAEPHGDTLAFVVGNNFQDEFIMKSTDNGNSWTKTVIYNSPFNLTGPSGNFNWIYCPDGTSCVALDNTGNAHVCFGLIQDSNLFSRQYTQGIIYWNENMPQLPQSLDPDSLKSNGNYIGWIIDTSIFLDPKYPPTSYYTSLTSNPGITIDRDNNLFVIWAGVTSHVDPYGYYLRHIYERTGHKDEVNTVYWSDTIRDLTCDNYFNNKECMYPDISPGTDNNIYVLAQIGIYAGSFVRCISISPMNCNYLSSSAHEMVVLKSLKLDLGVGFAENKELSQSFSVSDNYPNPFRIRTQINVITHMYGRLTFRISDITNREILILDKGYSKPGKYQFVIPGIRLSAGVYFYTVKSGDERITKKMVVE